MIADAGEWMSCWTMGLNQSTHGTWNTNAICNLHLATGAICRPGSGPMSLTVDGRRDRRDRRAHHDEVGVPDGLLEGRGRGEGADRGGAGRRRGVRVPTAHGRAGPRRRQRDGGAHQPGPHDGHALDRRPAAARSRPSSAHPAQSTSSRSDSAPSR